MSIRHLALFKRSTGIFGLCQMVLNMTKYKVDSVGKEFICNARDLGLISELGRSPEEENNNPLQYSCLGNLMNRGSWWAIVHGVTRKWKVESLSHVWLFATPWTVAYSSIHGIFQAGVLEWAAISFSRGSSQLRDQTRDSCIVDRCFTIWVTSGVWVEGHKSQTLFSN